MYDKRYRISYKKEVMQMDVVETIMDAGFDASIRERMDVEDYTRIVERALAGNQGAKTIYLDRFLNVVRNLDEGLYKGLIRKIIKYGPERGLEEFLTDVEDRVLLFEEEVRDRLRDSPAMPEPIEIELEDEIPTDELVFRFWNPGGGEEPVAEFTVLNPEDRPNFLREGIHDVVSAAWIPEMRRIVEDTLHRLKKEAE